MEADFHYFFNLIDVKTFWAEGNFKSGTKRNDYSYSTLMH